MLSGNKEEMIIELPYSFVTYVEHATARTLSALVAPYATTIGLAYLAQRHKLSMSHNLMMELFKPVVNGIIAKLAAMIDDVTAKGNIVDSVYLVGGFSNSDML